MKGITKIIQQDAKERVQELLNTQPTLKQIVDSEGWEGLEAYAEDPAVQEILEWSSLL